MVGVKNDGTICAADAALRFSGGPYYGMWAELGSMTAFACYDLKNVRTVGYEVLVNRPKTAAYRAPSAPMAAFAVESVIDELAHKLGMDVIDFRIKNANVSACTATIKGLGKVGGVQIADQTFTVPANTGDVTIGNLDPAAFGSLVTIEVSVSASVSAAALR